MAEKENVTRILCPLTDWQTTVATKGRGKGNTITSRLVIAADTRQWMVVLERQGGQSNALKYFKGFCHLLPIAMAEYTLNPIECVRRVVKALGIDLPAANVEPNMKAIGAVIDDVGKCNFNRIDHEDVYQRYMLDKPKLKEG